MTAFAANLSLLQEIVDRLATFERSLDEQIDALDTRSRRMRSTWAGSAAEEYAAAHEAWTAAARERQAALVALRRIVATAHGNYAEAVTANRAMWP